MHVGLKPVHVAKQRKSPQMSGCAKREHLFVLWYRFQSLYLIQSTPSAMVSTNCSFSLVGRKPGRSATPSKSAGCLVRPSTPGASSKEISSSSPALRRPPLILPPPATASRFTPNSLPRISIALGRSMRSLPATI